MSADLFHRTVASQLCPLRLSASDLGLVAVSFVTPDLPAVSEYPNPLLDLAARELTAYFAGTLRRFSVPLAPRGTAFQLAVWRALSAIPFGETRAYRDIARAIGRAGAERAVGAANGRNPIGIIIPCHRVIGADGTLTGYAGGLDKKQWLLAHEAGGLPRQAELFGA